MSYIPEQLAASLIYREGASPGGNIFAHFADANAAGLALGGAPYELVVDDTDGSPVVPSGSYDPTGMRLRGIGVDGSLTTLTFEDGAGFTSTNWVSIECIALASTSTMAVVKAMAAAAIGPTVSVTTTDAAVFELASNGAKLQTYYTSLGRGTVTVSSGHTVPHCFADAQSAWDDSVFNSSGSHGTLDIVAEFGATVPTAGTGIGSVTFVADVSTVTDDLWSTVQTTQTANYTMDTSATDPDGTVIFDTSSGAISFQLVEPAGAGRRLKIIDKANSFATHNLTIVRVGSEKIDAAAASKVLSTNGYRGWLEWDGTDWYTG